jgi:3-deoxy-manno-octulosonate cytidylyltransferase (CMP-KDO synthetase)
VIHTGSKSQKIAVAVIPARYNSTRLPGKALLPIAGKPLIVWVAERAASASSISRVIVATDDARISNAVTEAGFEAMMTRDDHKSGTDRVAEIATKLDAEIIVNIQGDEPLIAAGTIDRAVTALMNDPAAQMSTTSEEINDPADFTNPSVVKVSVDNDGNAVSFSRNPIPNQAVANHGDSESSPDGLGLLFSFRKHTGLYVYRRDFLLEFAGWPQSESEKAQSLEQLRALDRGVRIKVVEAASSSIGVDTAEDLERVRAIMSEPPAVAGGQVF